MKIRAYGSKALHAVINLRGVSTNKTIIDFYFVYNIYISEKCLTQMLQLNLLLDGKTFILQYLFKMYFFALKWPNT
jgi:hypothetical protein